MIDNSSAFHSMEYDGKIKKTLPYYEAFYRQVVDVVRTSRSDALTWLDVGCGTGKMAELALRDMPIKKFVFCDSSAEMIQTAQSRFDSDRTDFVVSKVQELNYKNQFDVVTAIQVNHYLHKDERDLAVRKCYEALKPDGIWVSFENFAPNSNRIEQFYLNRWKAYQLQKGKSREECERHIARYNRDYFPITLSEYFDLIKSSGFKEVEVLWLSYM